jgi:hypothetical protein
MRPALKPGLLAVWRNRDTVQIGIDPRRAIALTGMREAGALLRLLDGSRDRTQILAAAHDLGISPQTADRVITLLAAGGALHDFPAGTYRAMPPGARARLMPELATAGLAHGYGDGGAQVLARRQDACVRVEGMSRVGLWVASLLADSGIGLVASAGAGAAPGLRRRPDLVILADTHRRDRADALLREQLPHLAAAASEAIGVVGPLVLPGRSACLRCLDLARADRDPAWPMILAQLTDGGAEPPACDTVLAAAAAAQAAAAALTFIDRPASAGTVINGTVINGTLELVLPDWQWRRRTWQPHDRCGCGRRSTS